MLYLLSPLLFAEPFDYYIPSIDYKYFDDAMEEAAGASPDSSTEIRLWTMDSEGHWVRAESLLPSLPDVPEKEPIQAPWGGEDLPGEINGFLTSKAVYLSQAHGWIWFDSLGRFSTQRGILYDTIEDFHNAEGSDFYLSAYLENAGAAVYTARERDHNINMAISDNDGVGYTEVGGGFFNGTPGYGFKETSPYRYGENPFRQGSTRRFSATNGGIAQWIPEVPKDGYYAVYVSWKGESDNSKAAHYRIHHLGGTINRFYDQTIHGVTWQYVETLYLEAGVNSLTVELVGDGNDTGKLLSADAVRIGGGMGDVMRNGDLTGRPRWESGALMYTQFNGAPTSVYDPYGYGDGYDPASRSRWADWEHPPGEDAIYLSWHSNAGGGTGTSTYIHDNPYPGSSTLAGLVQNELVDVIRSEWDSNWSDRGVKSAAFAEVSPNSNNETPAILVELAFHDHEWDASLLKEPLFRRDSARAMYRGIVQYFAQKDGTSPVYLPEPPSHLMAIHTSDGIEVSWNPGPSGGLLGDQASTYRVFRSSDGRSWGNGVMVNGTTYTDEVANGETVYYRVAGVNSGGISFPSETVAIKKDPMSEPPILIVSSFDRLEASTLFWEFANPVGNVKRFDPRFINAYDTVVNHASAISEVGYAFDSVSDEQLSSVDLSRYLMVVWVAGEESTADVTFSSTDQGLIEAFWNNGGALWVSGAEILWDLDEKGSSEDRAFSETVLGALMESDDANTELAFGVGLLDGLSFDFSVASGGAYHVEYPDVLNTTRLPIAEYSTGGIAAAMGEQVALWGFPFECISDHSMRVEAARLMLQVLLDGYEIPDVVDEPSAEPSSEPSIESDDTASTDQDMNPDAVAKEGCGGCQTGSLPEAAFAFGLAVILMRRRRNDAKEL
ncbi:MAG: N-acetylmuramoyl-L-alanine amidase [Myxococcota bacterium]